MNIRLKFSRLGPVKYLGHLDMMRYFQKVLLRAEIDMKYSEGFNPHQILSFAYPLGVAMETLGDYMDIEVNSMESLDDIVQRMNAVMNEGVSIVSASIVPDDELNAMASVAAAKYQVGLNKNLLTESVNRINDFLGQNEILIKRESKKEKHKKQNKEAIKEATFKDIKEGIFDLELSESGDSICMFLQSGSSLNVKPIDVMNAYSEYINEVISITEIKRIDIYRYNSNNQLVPLGEF